MEKFKVSCPFCRHANELDKDMYNSKHLINLYEICEKCERVYGFDVEIKYHTFAFDPKIEVPDS